MTNQPARLNPASASVVAAAAWAIVYVIAVFVITTYEPDLWLRIVLSFLPAVPFAFYLMYTEAQIQDLDELHRRVHLEALAIAFPLTILLFMTLSLLTQSAVVSPDDWMVQNIWYFLPGLYAIGYTIAWRRYQ